MGQPNAGKKSDLLGVAARLRMVRAARRRFLLRWAIENAEPSEKKLIWRAVASADPASQQRGGD
jgi:hypothetical protein